MAPPKKRPGRPNKTQGNINKAQIKPGSMAAQGQALLQTSYAPKGPQANVTPSMRAVTDYYSRLPMKERKAAYRKLASATAASQSYVKHQGVLYQDLDPAARAGYEKAKSGSSGGSVGTKGDAGAMAYGVSASTGKFVAEKAGAAKASGEAETHGTRHKNKGGDKKKGGAKGKAKGKPSGRVGQRKNAEGRPADKGFHVSDGGKIVKNKGGQKKRPVKKTPYQVKGPR